MSSAAASVTTPLRSGMMSAPTPTEALMARKAQFFVHDAIDRYLGACARQLALDEAA